MKGGDWARKSAFSWSFSGNVPGVGGSNVVVPILRRAFGTWSTATPLLRFAQVTNGADIRINVGLLGPNIAGLTTPDGRQITITNGFAFAPTAASGSPSLLNVVTHEIGHALGLLHANTGNSIMFPTTSAQETLSRDDFDGIRALYGWPGQTPLNFTTEQAPALCVCGDTLAMVWRGGGDNRNIWIATSDDGLHWTQQRAFTDVGTIGGPALAWDGSRLWMVWRGTGNDQGLYFKTSRDFFVHDNPAQAPLSFAGSSHGPRIAIVRGVPTMVWKGINNDHQIYFSEFRSGRWQGQQIIPGVGTAAAPAICQDINGGIRLLWRGVPNDQALYTTAAPPGSYAWAPQSTLTWYLLGNGTTVPVSSGTAGSWCGPSLTVETSQPNFTTSGESVIHAAWRGIDGDQGLYFSQLARDQTGAAGESLNWSSQAKIPNVGSSQPPSIVSFKRQLVLAWKGVENDTRVYAIST
ncbi:matrixin family metalloprotease [Paraburkholderia ferrariae]|uniref:Matrixin family metalloprotease n=1 Tax=Paraburkholderia ferrariae TaxID=386056 RepID=A0ABU9S1W7_9BURK